MMMRRLVVAVLAVVGGSAQTTMTRVTALRLKRRASVLALTSSLHALAATTCMAGVVASSAPRESRDVGGTVAIANGMACWTIHLFSASGGGRPDCRLRGRFRCSFGFATGIKTVSVAGRHDV